MHSAPATAAGHNPRSRERRGPAWGRIIASALVIAALAAAWRYTPISDYLTHDNVERWAQSVRAVEWAPIAVVLAYTPAAFLMFPRPLITLFAVIAYGPWLGFIYGMGGILLSALAAYGAGRALPPDTVKRYAGDKLDRVTAVLRRHGVLAVFAMRIVPIAPHAVESVVAGAMRIKAWHFVAGTFAGMLPGVLTATVFGDQITAALEDASKINYGLIAGLVLLCAATTYFVRRWFMRQQRSA